MVSLSVLDEKIIDSALSLRYNVKKVDFCRVDAYLVTKESDDFMKKYIYCIEKKDNI